MKYLKLRVFRMGEKNSKEVITVPVESFDVNLIETIRTVVPDKREYVAPCTIAFRDNFANMDMMNFEECFPYIIRNGKYEWTVPYNEVTIHEFFTTNKLKEKDKVNVYINNYGGGDGFYFTDIIPWLIAAVPFFKNTIETIDAFCKLKSFAKTIYSTFGTTNMPWPKDVTEAIMKRRRWEKSDLGKMLGTDNDVLLEMILSSSGFKEKDGVYIRSKIRFQKYRKETDKSYAVLWGDDEKKHVYRGTAARLCCELNMALTDLMLNSINLKSDCFEIAMKQVESIIETTPCLEKGKFFHFVTISDKEGFLRGDGDENDHLERELEELLWFVRKLLEYIMYRNKTNSNDCQY